MIQLPPAKAYIFDMDGTLTDNMHFHHEAWMKFIAIKKLVIDAATFEPVLILQKGLSLQASR